jgi:hypothetical protein
MIKQKVENRFVLSHGADLPISPDSDESDAMVADEVAATID